MCNVLIVWSMLTRPILFKEEKIVVPKLSMLKVSLLRVSIGEALSSSLTWVIIEFTKTLCCKNSSLIYLCFIMIDLRLARLPFYFLGGVITATYLIDPSVLAFLYNSVHGSLWVRVAIIVSLTIISIRWYLQGTHFPQR